MQGSHGRIYSSKGQLLNLGLTSGPTFPGYPAQSIHRLLPTLEKSGSKKDVVSLNFQDIPWILWMEKIKKNWETFHMVFELQYQNVLTGIFYPEKSWIQYQCKKKAILQC